MWDECCISPTLKTIENQKYHRVPTLSPTFRIIQGQASFLLCSSTHDWRASPQIASLCTWFLRQRASTLNIEYRVSMNFHEFPTCLHSWKHIEHHWTASNMFIEWCAEILCNIWSMCSWPPPQMHYLSHSIIETYFVPPPPEPNCAQQKLLQIDLSSSQIKGSCTDSPHSSPPRSLLLQPHDSGGFGTEGIALGGDTKGLWINLKRNSSNIYDPNWLYVDVCWTDWTYLRNIEWIDPKLILVVISLILCCDMLWQHPLLSDKQHKEARRKPARHVGL